MTKNPNFITPWSEYDNKFENKVQDERMKTITENNNYFDKYWNK